MNLRFLTQNVPLSYRGVGGRELIGLATLLVAASFALFWLAGRQGPTRRITDSVPFEERGVFDYSAALGRDIYDDDQLRVPQPLFRRLGEQLPLTYTYQTRSASPDFAIEGGRGSYSLTAEVRQQNGWVRTVAVVPRTEFEGTAFDTAAVVDISMLAEFIRRLEVETGYRAPQFTVRIRAHVEFEGMLHAQRLERVLDQTLVFTLSEFELKLETSGVGGDQTQIDRLEPGEVTFSTTVPRTLTAPLLGTEVPVSDVPGLARYPLIAGLLLGVLAAVATAIDFRIHPTGAGPPGIPARYRDRVIDVDPNSQPPPGGIVRLQDLPSLLRLAEQYQSPVLRSARSEGAMYWVVADSVYVFDETGASDGAVFAAQYRAKVAASTATPAAPAPPAPPAPSTSPAPPWSVGVAYPSPTEDHQPVAASSTPVEFANASWVTRPSAVEGYPPAAEATPTPAAEPAPAPDTEEAAALSSEPASTGSVQPAAWFEMGADDPASTPDEPDAGSLGVLPPPRLHPAPAVDPAATSGAAQAGDVPSRKRSRWHLGAAWFSLFSSGRTDEDGEPEAGSVGLGVPPHRAFQLLESSSEEAPDTAGGDEDSQSRVYWGDVWPPEEEADDPNGTAAA